MVTTLSWPLCSGQGETHSVLLTYHHVDVHRLGRVRCTAFRHEAVHVHQGGTRGHGLPQVAQDGEALSIRPVVQDGFHHIAVCRDRDVLEEVALHR